MEVRIGIRDVAREVVLETDSSAEEVIASVENAVQTGGLLTLTDDKGRKVLVPGAVLGFVDIGASESRRVGFGNA